MKPTVNYTKGGSKADVTIMFGNTVLKEKVDYTLSYKNNSNVEDDNNIPDKKAPEVRITGKGNFKGKLTKNYSIVRPEPVVLTMTLADKVFKEKANIYKSTPKIVDSNNKALKANTDYDKNIIYTYKEDTPVKEVIKGKEVKEVVRLAGEEVGKKDIITAKTWIHVTVKTKGKYKGIVEGDYRIIPENISKAKVTYPNKFIYTGEKIVLNESNTKVKIKNVELILGKDYEILEKTYQNNIKKGTAKVTIQGIGNYGGTKTISFKIQTKKFEWAEILKKLFGN